MGKQPKVSGVYYQPWCGPHYGDASASPFRSRRILVLGESHYTTRADGDGPDLTEWCVENYALNEKKRRRYFTSVASALTGERPVSIPSKQAAWRSIAFYNYVQKRVGAAARRRPTEEMWNEGSKPFRAVLKALAPDVVFVFGKELWENMPDADVATKLRATRGSLGIRAYRTGGRGGHALAYGMRHPSGRGFLIEDAMRVARKVLGAAGR